jgi:catechol 2,3-dioxygenase-like lactoylglutathione lyase family enzyme
MVKQESLQWKRLGLDLLQDWHVEGDWPGLFDAPSRGWRAVFLSPGRDQGDGQGVPRGRQAARMRDGEGQKPTRWRRRQAAGINRRGTAVMDYRLEVVVVPVSNVDKAKDFYQGLGWRLDADFATGEDFRVVQLTPPGSQCSIIFGTGITSAAPGSADGLQLTVTDIDAARDELVTHGADVSEVFHDAGGVFHHAGTEGRVSGPAPEHKSYGSFASFSDPDGNGWLLQEITTRLPGR